MRMLLEQNNGQKKLKLKTNKKKNNIHTNLDCNKF